MNLRKFAAEINTSVSTVSKALNGYPDVSEKTRQRIVKAAKRLGYVPSPLGRQLRTNTANAIGFVLSSPQTGFAHPFFLDMLLGIDEGLASTNFQIIITSSRRVDNELDSFKRLVERQRVDAMIFSRMHRQDARVAFLQKNKIPFATFGRSENGEPFPFVDLDYKFAGSEGCRILLEMGHKRIALLNGPRYLMFGYCKREGYEAEMRAADIRLDRRLIVEEDLSEKGGARGLRRLMKIANPPTAILCAHDLMAVGAMRELTRLGKRPGSDVAFIGNDSHPLGQYCDPPLTTFSAETRKAGHRLVEFLIRHMNGTPALELQEVWKPELILRSSHGSKLK